MKFNDVFGHPEWETAKRILCAIIQEAGGTLDGQVRLNKAFYWAHLAFWRKHSGMLSNYPMARFPNGPAIHRGEDLLFELQTEGLLKITEKKIQGLSNAERRFKLKGGFKVNITDSEKDAICEGLAKIHGKTGRQVSDDTHRTSKSWKRKRDGQILNIYEDLLTDEEFQAGRQADAEAKALLEKIFT